MMSWLRKRAQERAKQFKGKVTIIGGRETQAGFDFLFENCPPIMFAAKASELKLAADSLFEAHTAALAEWAETSRKNKDLFRPAPSIFSQCTMLTGMAMECLLKATLKKSLMIL